MAKFEADCIGGPYNGQRLGSEHETVELVIYPPMTMDEMKRNVGDGRSIEPQPAGRYVWRSVFMWEPSAVDLLAPATGPIAGQDQG